MTHRLDLEQQALGERPVRREDKALVDDVHADSERILAAHPPATVLAEVHRRAALPVKSPRRSWPQPRLSWLPVPVFAVVGLVLLWPSSPPLGPVDVIKGQATLVISKGGVPLKDGDVVASGDIVVLTLVPGGSSHAVVVSFDSAGAVTLHHPANQDAATSLPRSSFAFSSFRFDDQGEFERFIVFTDSEPVDVAALLNAVRAVAMGPAAASARVTTATTTTQTSLVLRR